MPISSLPSRFGIGSFSKEAYEFVDFLHEAGQGLWQILPIGPTGFGDSPYQSVSMFAGNPYFISPEVLIEDGLLSWDEANSFDFGSDQEKVDYGALYNNRFRLLRVAFEHFRAEASEEEQEKYAAFCEQEKYWLEDYALFMALKQKNEGKAWSEWEEGVRERDPKALEEAKEELAEEVDFFCFQQYEFNSQWERLHAYAQRRNVKIVGDMPFYCAMDGSDAWAHPKVFDFDENHEPVTVAGCPPDAFSATGQLWGNPIYNWDHLKRHNYGWWVERFRRMSEFYDVIRIDHFIGFAEYWAVPYGDETAENGEMLPGPGLELFTALSEQLGDLDIIAEDLGILTPVSEKLLADCGFPGMKVLQYAFDPSESSYYLSYNHVPNSVVYTGTHDNNTTLGWISTCSDHDRDFARHFINSVNTNYGAFVWDFIREAYRSVCDTCIVPLQDYLVLGEEARINCPGSMGTNWQWRLRPNFLSDDLARSIHELSRLYGRLPKDPVPEKEESEDAEAAESAEKAAAEA